jgi:hypothetical protein
MKTAMMLVGLFAMSALTTDARADGTCKRVLQNDTPNPVWVSFAYKRRAGSWFCDGGNACGSKFKVVGWFKILSGETAIPSNYPEYELTEYFVAADEFGHVWKNENNWGACIPHDAHNLCVSPSQHAPDSCPSGQVRAPFAQIDFADNNACDAVCLTPEVHHLTL